jgi:HK97 family phage prohead protease
MKTKRMRLEIKEISETGSFEGLLSPYGNRDMGRDVVEAGAYTKTLKDRGNVVPMLWQHDETEPIGSLTLEDRADGLYCKGQLLMELPEAKKAYALIKARIVKGLSIGFEAVKDAVVNGVRHLKEIKLYEGSIVTFPMNEMALITSVKGLRQIKGDFNEELTENQLQDAGYQMCCALSQALCSVIWSEATREEMLSASETIIQQFSDAYMAYLPQYLDMLAELYGMDTKAWKRQREAKAGRRHSAADRAALQGVIDSLSALITEEAGGDATSEGEAAGETKSEPEIDHSAVSSLLTKAKETYKWNCNSN